MVYVIIKLLNKYQAGVAGVIAIYGRKVEWYNMFQVLIHLKIHLVSINNKLSLQKNDLICYPFSSLMQHEQRHEQPSLLLIRPATKSQLCCYS